jgi:hypothetical protein
MAPLNLEVSTLSILAETLEVNDAAKRFTFHVSLLRQQPKTLRSFPLSMSNSTSTKSHRIAPTNLQENRDTLKLKPPKETPAH